MIDPQSFRVEAIGRIGDDVPGVLPALHFASIQGQCYRPFVEVHLAGLEQLVGTDKLLLNVRGSGPKIGYRYVGTDRGWSWGHVVVLVCVRERRGSDKECGTKCAENRFPHMDRWLQVRCYLG